MRRLSEMLMKFLWAGKAPRYRREILESEIKVDGLKLLNISMFDTALKLGWLKIYLQSSNICTIFPREF